MIAMPSPRYFFLLRFDIFHDASARHDAMLITLLATMLPYRYADY